jgi:MoaA/NifB/PqqE/SkfB family radical SAM enzyme
MACSYCPLDHSGLPNEDLERGVNSILKIRPRFIWVGGGEPCLVPDIASILRRIKKEAGDPWIAFNTNFLGRLSVLEEVAETVDAVYVSLDGFDRENRVNRGYDGQPVIERLVEFAPRHEDLHWAVNTVTTVDNLESLESFARGLQERLPGISHHFWPMTPENHPRSPGSTPELVSRFRQTMERLREWHPALRFSLPTNHVGGTEKTSLHHPLDKPPPEKQLKVCHRQFFIADVCADGEIEGCLTRQLQALDNMATRALWRGSLEDMEQVLRLLDRQRRRMDPYNPICSHPCSCFQDIDSIILATSVGDPGLRTIPELTGKFPSRERRLVTRFIRESFNPCFEEAFFDHLGDPNRRRMKSVRSGTGCCQ